MFRKSPEKTVNADQGNSMRHPWWSTLRTFAGISAVTLLLAVVAYGLFLYVRSADFYDYAKCGTRGWINSPHELDAELGFRAAPGKTGEEFYAVGPNIVSRISRDGFPHPRGRAGHGPDTAPPGLEPRLFLRFRLLDPGRGKLRLSLRRRAPRHGAQCRGQQLRPVPHAAARPQAHPALQARHRHLPVCALARGPVLRLCPDLFRQAARTVFLPGCGRRPAPARTVLFEPDL
jgi:hypothetical protein